MRIHVPAFPAATAIIRADGSAELTVSGLSRPVPSRTVDEARELIIESVVDLAGKLQRPVRLSTKGDGGDHELAVHPNGHVTALEADGYTDAEFDVASVVDEPAKLPDVQPATVPATDVPTAEPATIQLPGAELKKMAAAAAVAAAAEAIELEASPERQPSYLLVFSTGERIPVTGLGLVGRKPRATTAEPIVHLVAIADASRTVSRTHLAFGLAHDGSLWVRDLGSANGTRLVDDHAAVTLSPAQDVAISAGSRIQFGDHWFVVQAAA